MLLSEMLLKNISNVLVIPENEIRRRRVGRDLDKVIEMIAALNEKKNIMIDLDDEINDSHNYEKVIGYCIKKTKATTKWHVLTALSLDYDFPCNTRLHELFPGEKQKRKAIGVLEEYFAELGYQIILSLSYFAETATLAGLIQAINKKLAYIQFKLDNAQ